MLRFEERVALEDCFECLNLGDIEGGISHLRKLGGASFLPKDYLEDIVNGLENSDWTGVGSRFARSSFIDKNGYFLLIGPYSRRRDGFRETALSGMFGVVTLNIDIGEVQKTIDSLFDAHGDAFSQVLGFRLFTSFGLVGGEKGEAFVVPTSWQFPQALDGPALNDMTEQTVRLRLALQSVDVIFDEQTLGTLLPTVLDPIRSASLRNLEYQYHDAGHSTGRGIKYKMRSGWFRQPRNCGIEEWRSDGVMFKLAAEMAGQKVTSKLVASNLVLRFGVDAHRKGGVERDPDVYCTTLLLDDLIESGHFDVTSTGKIVFGVRKADELACLIVPMMRRALDYTKAELSDQSKLEQIYEGLKPSDEAVRILNEIVRAASATTRYLA